MRCWAYRGQGRAASGRLASTAGTREVVNRRHYPPRLPPCGTCGQAVAIVLRVEPDPAVPRTIASVRWIPLLQPCLRRGRTMNTRADATGVRSSSATGSFAAAVVRFDGE